MAPFLNLRAGPSFCLHVIDELRALERDFADDPACYLDRQDWGVPFRLSEQGEISLQLMLPG
jgi:hypothetical protein